MSCWSDIHWLWMNRPPQFLDAPHIYQSNLNPCINTLNYIPSIAHTHMGGSTWRNNKKPPQATFWGREGAVSCRGRASLLLLLSVVTPLLVMLPPCHGGAHPHWWWSLLIGGGSTLTVVSLGTLSCLGWSPLFSGGSLLSLGAHPHQWLLPILIGGLSWSSASHVVEDLPSPVVDPICH